MDYREIKSKTVILDFDGTICRIFEGYDLKKVSSTLHNEMKLMDINFSESKDCFEVFHSITQQTSQGSKLREQAYFIAHEIIMKAECKAVDTGVDVIGATVFINFLLQHEIKLGIATNNSEECVRKYLENKGISKAIPIVGRHAFHPEYLKPNPWSLTSVLDKVSSNYNETIFIGDSLNDYYCAKKKEVYFIGMASTEKKKKRLQAIDDNIEIVENYFDILKNLNIMG